MISARSDRRKALALVTLLVLMAFLTVMLSVLTLQVVSQRHRLQQRERQLQAEWLARAGVELAAARLLDNPAGFSEDNQELAPDAKVHIVVEKTGENTYSVTSEAAVGRKEEQGVTHTINTSFRRTDRGSVRLSTLK